MKTAIVLGATGLIGKHLTEKLLSDEDYSKVKTFTRRRIEIDHPKLEQHIVNFDRIDEWKNNIRGEVLFSAMGTTIKKADGRAAQYKIDYTYQYEFAEAAAENGVGKYCLVSSAGANPRSKNFYLRIKGELENKISELAFGNISIFRPSLLLGKRDEKRFAEELGAMFLEPVTRFIPLLRKYRPVKAETVAKYMIDIASREYNTKVIIYSSAQIQTAFNS